MAVNRNPIKKKPVKKVAAKKAAPTVLERIQKLIGDIIVLDEEGDDANYYAGLRLEISEDGIDFADDYNGWWGASHKTLENAEADLLITFSNLKRESGKRVSNLTISGKDAKVTLDGIEVGCEEVSFEKFDELAKAVAEMRPKVAAKKPAPKKVPLTSYRFLR